MGGEWTREDARRPQQRQSMGGGRRGLQITPEMLVDHNAEMELRRLARLLGQSHASLHRLINDPPERRERRVQCYNSARAPGGCMEIQPDELTLIQGLVGITT